MPEQVTLTAVSEKTKTWTGQQGGSFIDYFVKTDAGGEQVYTHTRKPDSPRPQVGESFEAEVQPSQGDYPPKLKRISQRPGGGGRSPEENKRIVRQHSQEMALRFATATGWLAELDLTDDQVTDEVLKIIRHLTDWFEKDVA